jgi:hypothetical protein
MQKRMQYLKGGTRPQAMLWSDNSGTLSDGYYIPNGIEGEDFIIVSDHNRSELSISQQRIDNKQRMINGTMRSYWIADKLIISTGWSRLPSRAFSEDIEFDENGNIVNENYSSYTVDGGSGGVDILSWYETHPNPFWVFLAYDKFKVNGISEYDKLGKYNQVVRMYFTAFDYSIEKRGSTWSNGDTGFDFWNINISLEEV